MLCARAAFRRLAVALKLLAAVLRSRSLRRQQIETTALQVDRPSRLQALQFRQSNVKGLLLLLCRLLAGCWGRRRRLHAPSAKGCSTN